MSSVPALLLIHDGEMALPICDVAPSPVAGRYRPDPGAAQERFPRASNKNGQRRGARACAWLACTRLLHARSRAGCARSLARLR